MTFASENTEPSAGKPAWLLDFGYATLRTCDEHLFSAVMFSALVGVLSVVTRSTHRLEVAWLKGKSGEVSDWTLVMHDDSRSDALLFEASFTEWMLVEIRVPRFLPLTADIEVPLVFICPFPVVSLRDLVPMEVAVSLAWILDNVLASGMTTEVFRCIRHSEPHVRIEPMGQSLTHPIQVGRGGESNTPIAQSEHIPHRGLCHRCASVELRQGRAGKEFP
jgi:hypothetical protein